MTAEPASFFQAALTAGAILTGFCGTFMAFRIQREADYYRQPRPDQPSGEMQDAFVGLTHFTSPFFLLILATACSMFFGFAVPLLAVAGSPWALAQQGMVVAGLIASLVLVASYFVDEMVHYRILTSELVDDAREWREELWIVVVALVLAIVIGAAACLFVAGSS